MRKWLLGLVGVAVGAVARSQTSGLGVVANNLMDPVMYMSDFIYTCCFVIGGSFLLASVLKYVEHRRNPLAIPLSTVVFLLIAGLFLVALPFAYLIIQGGSPYSVFAR